MIAKTNMISTFATSPPSNLGNPTRLTSLHAIYVASSALVAFAQQIAVLALLEVVAQAKHELVHLELPALVDVHEFEGFLDRGGGHHFAKIAACQQKF